MKKSICLFLVILLVVSVFTPCIVMAESTEILQETSLPAFPGAEGGGMWTTGARNDGSAAVEVYHVYKLTDDGSVGTFRDAVSKSNRVIVFDVAGNIELTDTLTIKGDNLTILGQTAPGDGICVKNCNTDITGNNVILRYMRFRMGDDMTMEEDTIGSRNRKNIIVDHCTISWCVDECASFYDMTDFTMQWCIISESLKESVHDKGSHGYGGIWGGTNASYHHNLLAHHDSRNPRIGSGTVLGDTYDMSTQYELTDLRNNVIYNWGGNTAYGGQCAAPVNIINSYYKYGPATKSGVKSRIFQITASGNGKDYDWSTDLYVDGNYVYGSSSVTSDNSKGVVKDDKTKNSYTWTSKNITDEAKAVHFRYEKDYPVTTQTAEDAYASVLESAGASIVRDSVDTRIINEVKTGTAPCGADGLINTPSDAGGYPVLSGTKAKDSDNDGIPNEYEDKFGLDKYNKADGLTVSPSGYLYIEEYANALADGSYVRDTAYDPDVADYDPSLEPTPTPSADAEPSYKTELVSSWAAKSGDEKKAAGTEFMPGLVGTIQLERGMSDTKTFSDGFTNNYAITCKENNGVWDAVNGVATGCAMKYTASEDGFFTIYAYGVSVKTPPTVFYAVPEGATDLATENIYSNEIDESAKKVLCKIPVESGKSYYFFIAGGSKTRFCGAKFERILYDNVMPYEFKKAEFSSDGKLQVELKQNKDINSAKLILAEYTADNVLSDVKTYEIDGTAVKDLDYTKNTSVDHINLYIWNNENSVVPLSEAASNIK